MYNVVYKVMYLFMFFFIASMIGYIAEVTCCSIKDKKLVWNRGFLIGPYIPIYGVGCIATLILLRKYFSDPITLFFLTIIVCSALEYFTSWIMEKLFKVRWWDYSEYRFNVDGRILFGFAGLIVVYFVYPFIRGLLDKVPHTVLIVVGLICLVIFLTDLVVTFATLISVRKTLADFKGKDATEIAREEVIKKIKKKSYLFNRLLKAFPKTDKFNKKEFIEFKKTVQNIRKKIKDKTDEYKDSITREIQKVKNKNTDK